jgi:hypothetical protein
MRLFMRISEHSREGSDWVDDIKGHTQGQLRGRTELVKIVEDAAERGLGEFEAIETSLKSKAEEFTKEAAELYAKS